MSLNARALLGMLQLLIALALFLFVPAWTLHYWQAWVFLAVFFTSTLGVTLYLMKHDPKLLERRVAAGPGAEKQTAQKVIQALASLAFLALFVVSALDHRFAWSVVPLAAVIGGDGLVALGLFVVFLVFRANSFTSATIEVGAEQRVISAGPYAIVRHPMYAGAFVMLVGVPLALGSWWGLLAVIPMIVVIVWRLLDEEKFLAANLAGYTEYREKVRHRIVPLLW
jgi:protein-S-isoprenylcysteine O-methyltransferase Ste14